MGRIILATFLLLLFVSFPGQAQVVGALTPVDQEVTAFMARWQLSGGTVALVQDGRLVYNRAYGQADSGVVAQPHHLYRIASLSKPITALAILKLREQGRLKLNDKVFGPRGILPYADYPFFDRRIQDITVRHLLQHTAGWDRNTNIGGDPMFNPVAIAAAMGVPAPAGAATIIRYVLKKPLDFAPGTHYAYSNIGYSILGRVIEALSGLAYETFVQAHILHPLGITHMQLGRNFYSDKHPAEVRYFEDAYAGLVRAINGEPKLVPWAYGGFNLEAMDAHGGWLATAEDLARLLVAIDGYSNRPDILSAEDRQLLLHASDVNPGYGLGWMVNSHGIIWHTGSLPGTSTLMAQRPDGLSWVLLFNGRHDSAVYFHELDQLMWRALSQLQRLPAQDLFADPALADGSLPNPEAGGPTPVEVQR